MSVRVKSMEISYMIALIYIKKIYDYLSVLNQKKYKATNTILHCRHSSKSNRKERVPYGTPTQK
jgi:hypothetical protein